MKKRISENIIEYLTKHAGNETKIGEFSEFIERFFCDMEEEYSEVKMGFMMDLEEFTDELEEEALQEMVERFKRKDGTLSGIKWTMNEVEDVIKQYGVKEKLEGTDKPCNLLKFWVAMNYVYATHYSINRTLNGYIDLAVDEYANKNICFDTLLKKVFERM
jgi:hypothetical protein